jgi:hypothetical protein
MFFFRAWNSVWYKLLRLLTQPASQTEARAANQHQGGVHEDGTPRPKAPPAVISCFDSIIHCGILLSSNKTFVRLTDTLTKP